VKLLDPQPTAYSRKGWIVNYFKQRSVVSINKTIALKVASDIIYVNLKKERAQNRTLGNATFNSVPIR
jgi:hypothetical protein